MNASTAIADSLLRHAVWRACSPSPRGVGDFVANHQESCGLTPIRTRPRR